MGLAALNRLIWIGLILRVYSSKMLKGRLELGLAHLGRSIQVRRNAVQKLYGMCDPMSSRRGRRIVLFRAV